MKIKQAKVETCARCGDNHLPIVKCDRYNGWANYETWNVKLWIDNDEGSYGYWYERTKEIFDNAEADNTFTKIERAKLDLAEALKDEAEENTPTVTGTYADLLNAALSEVRWYDIAEALLEDQGLI